MVTTRSAEKNALSSNKTEDLALRSKPEEGDMPIDLSDSDLSLPSSIRMATKITVNVPPPRRGTRLNKTELNDADTTPKAKTNTAIETPESQASLVETNPAENLHAQSDSVSPDALELSPSLIPKAKRKREPTDTVPDNAMYPAANPKSNQSGRHERFGGEEVGSEERSIALDIDVIQPQQTLEVADSEDDDDDAPEVATTKTSIPINTRSKRSTRLRKPVREADEPSAHSEIDPTAVIHANVLTQDTLPSLRIDTEQDPESTVVADSDNSPDSAFVTARTTRHIDVFATPTSDTMTTSSPLPPQVDLSLHQSTLSAQQPVLSSSTLSKDLPSLKLNQPRSTPRSTGRRSVPLPRKAGNTLEQYRQQLLQTRVERNSGVRRGRAFNMEEDWPSKRRKFVVGF